jgi:hypothetical protein
MKTITVRIPDSDVETLNKVLNFLNINFICHDLKGGD